MNYVKASIRCLYKGAGSGFSRLKTSNISEENKSNFCEKFNVSHTSVLCELKMIGKVLVLGKWSRNDLSPRTCRLLRVIGYTVI